jgi:N-methylhydantoinase A
MLETEIRRDFARSYVSPLAGLDVDDLATGLEAQEGEALDSLAAEGISRETGRVEHALDIRYVGQEYTLTIPLQGADEPTGDGFPVALSARFDEAHETRFGHANPGAPIELVAVRSTGLGDLGRAEPQRLGVRDGAGYPSEEQAIVFGRQERRARVARRDDLPPGSVVEGPAVIVEATATTVVPPGWTLRVDEFGTLALEAA